MLFIAVWLLLFFLKKNYYGSGLEYVQGKHPDYEYFSESFPHLMYYPSCLAGFLTHVNDTNTVSGFWFFNVRKKEVTHRLLDEQTQIRKVFSILPSQDTSFYIIGKLGDSVSYIMLKVKPDSIWIKRFSLPSDPISACFHQNRLWMFIRGGKGYVVEGLYLEKDSFMSKRYRLPNFFNRISHPAGVVSDGKKLKFLFYTTHYPYKGVWIRYDTSRFSYFMLYDEKLTYPLYSVRLKISVNQLKKNLNKFRFGLLPSGFAKEWWDIDADSLYVQKTFAVDGFYRTVYRQGNVLLTVFEEESPKNWLLHFYDPEKQQRFFLFFKKKQKGFELYDTRKDKNVAFLNEEKPSLLLPISQDTLLFLTSAFNMALVSPQRGLLGYRSFIKLVHYHILKNNPGKVFFFEAMLPEWQALFMFFILYGLPIFVLISLFVFYLIDLLKTPAIFSDEKRIPLYARFFPATLLYGIVLLLKINDFLTLFSLIKI